MELLALAWIVYICTNGMFHAQAAEYLASVYAPEWDMRLDQLLSPGSSRKGSQESERRH